MRTIKEKLAKPHRKEYRIFEILTGTAVQDFSSYTWEELLFFAVVHGLIVSFAGNESSSTYDHNVYPALFEELQYRLDNEDSSLLTKETYEKANTKVNKYIWSRVKGEPFKNFYKDNLTKNKR